MYVCVYPGIIYYVCVLIPVCDVCDTPPHTHNTFNAHTTQYQIATRPPVYRRNLSHQDVSTTIPRVPEEPLEAPSSLLAPTTATQCGIEPQLLSRASVGVKGCVVVVVSTAPSVHSTFDSVSMNRI